MKESKTCSTCKQSKTLDAFHKDASRNDGLNGRCKACKKVYFQSHKADYRRRAESFLADKPHYFRDWKRNNRELAEKHRKKWLDKDPGYYSRYRTTLDPDERRQYFRSWRLANPERASEAQKRRRARKKGAGSFTVVPRDYRRCLDRHNGRCAYCKTMLVSVHWDHVVPLYRGGSHSVGNLVPACQPCNQRKSYKTLMEWRMFRMRATA